MQTAGFFDGLIVEQPEAAMKGLETRAGFFKNVCEPPGGHGWCVVAAVLELFPDVGRAVVIVV